jgi:ATP-dependent Clp protease ATP-binding subunit ClpB
MNPEKFTERAGEAIKGALELASEKGNTIVTPVHLLSALIDAKDGLAKRVLSTCGADIFSLKSSINASLERLPRQTPAPPEPTISAAFRDCLKRADSSRKAQGDQYVAVDHLLVACAQEKEVSALLTPQGISMGELSKALAKVRPSSSKVDSQTADANYDALNQFAINLIDQARNGKVRTGRREKIAFLVELHSQPSDR